MCQQDNSKSYGWIFLKFWVYVGHGKNYQRLNFGGDPAGILDSGSLWNFRYLCVKGGIREPLAKRRWWRHLANNTALAEVPAGYDCFLVRNCNCANHAWSLAKRECATLRYDAATRTVTVEWSDRTSQAAVGSSWVMLASATQDRRNTSWLVASRHRSDTQNSSH